MQSDKSLEDFLKSLKQKSKVNFCVRPTQELMIRQVWQALKENLISLIEAPTGTGKSLAYLIPALLYVQEELTKNQSQTFDKESVSPTVISTATLTLQNQLIEKDIPMALQLINNPSLSVFVLKGRANYLCKKRLKEFFKRQQDLNEKQKEHLQYICEWAEKTCWGDKEELPFVPDTELWSQLCCEANICASLRCALNEECFFYRNKREASKSTLIVVNHALLAHDLVIKSLWGLENELQAILPPYKQLIIDEAHKFSHNLESASSLELSYPLLSKLLKRIDPKRKGNILHAGLLWDRKIIERINNNINELSMALKEADLYLLNHFDSLPNEDPFLRKASFKVLSSAVWESTTYRNYLHMNTNAYKVLKELLKNLKELRETKKNEKEGDAQIAELNGLSLELAQSLKGWKKFLEQNPEDELAYARWIKINRQDPNSPYISFHLHPLDIGDLLKKKIYPFLKTLLFTSATLSVNNTFCNIADTLGLSYLSEDRLKTLSLPSSFSPHQVHFCGPCDFPIPETNQSYLRYVLPAIQHLIGINPHGGTLILTTSYELVTKIEEYLHRINIKIPLYSQGLRTSNKQLLNQFKQNKPSVLIGTDSFWEGIDLPGDFLTLVIIVKLPFANPSDPLHYTKKQHLQQIKKVNPFTHYDLPQAVLKFKQGFGRLMRQKNDWGAVVCLDSRLKTKKYGEVFLKSLQPHQFHAYTGEELMEKLENYLAKNRTSQSNFKASQ